MTKDRMTAVQNKDDEDLAPRLLQENYLKYQQMVLIIWEIRSILKNKIRLFMKSLRRYDLGIMSNRRNVIMTRRRKHRLSRRET